jgi:hypothetical protein
MIKGDAKERLGLGTKCGMAENRPKDCRGGLCHRRGGKWRHCLIAAERGASAKLKRRTGGIFLCRCAMVLTVAAATKRQFPVSTRGKRTRSDQRKAEH